MKNKYSGSITVVIPAYNEETRIGNSLDRILEYFRSNGISSEIIIVDDGSEDRTVEIAAARLKSGNFKILRNNPNRGKGFSVRRGMLEAEGDYVLFSDADLSTPIEELDPFMRYMEEGYDCVIGSRALKESQVVVHQNRVRESMGRIFNAFAKMMSFRHVEDSQCGFKLFTREAAQYLFTKQKLFGFSFDAEIIYLAQQKGYRIREQPVKWVNSPNSRVRILIDPLLMFWDLARIRWLHR